MMASEIGVSIMCGVIAALIAAIIIEIARRMWGARKRWLKSLRIYWLLLPVFLLGGVLRGAAFSSAPFPSVPRFTFDDSVRGWQVSSAPDAQGIRDVKWSDSGGADGRPGCLQAGATLTSGSPDKMKGEVYVHMKTTRPAGAQPPVDLRGRDVFCYVKWEGEATGKWEDAPCMVSMVLRDSNSRAAYGRNDNVVSSQTDWFRVSFSLEEASHVDKGFNLQAVTWIGVKFAANQKGASAFAGTIYVDDVSW